MNCALHSIDVFGWDVWVILGLNVRVRRRYYFDGKEPVLTSSRKIFNFLAACSSDSSSCGGATVILSLISSGNELESGDSPITCPCKPLITSSSSRYVCPYEAHQWKECCVQQWGAGRGGKGARLTDLNRIDGLLGREPGRHGGFWSRVSTGSHREESKPRAGEGVSITDNLYATVCLLPQRGTKSRLCLPRDIQYG
jgi:hypothetical protein